MNENKWIPVSERSPDSYEVVKVIIERDGVTSWQDWCRGAEVVQRGEETKP